MLTDDIVERHELLIDRSDPNEIHKLENHWNSTPIVKEFGLTARYDISDQSVRSKILEICRLGISENEGEKQIRYALNPKELLYLVNSDPRFDVKLPNIYFHLEKLVKGGFLEEVSKLTDGRYTVSYYGRTAKFFLYTSEEMADKLEGIKSSFVNLFPSEEDRISTFMDEYVKVIGDHSRRIIDWIVTNERTIVEKRIDIVDLYTFLTRLGKGMEFNDKINDFFALIELY